MRNLFSYLNLKDSFLLKLFLILLSQLSCAGASSMDGGPEVSRSCSHTSGEHQVLQKWMSTCNYIPVVEVDENTGEETPKELYLANTVLVPTLNGRGYACPSSLLWNLGNHVFGHSANRPARVLDLGAAYCQTTWELLADSRNEGVPFHITSVDSCREHLEFGRKQTSIFKKKFDRKHNQYRFVVDDMCRFLEKDKGPYSVVYASFSFNWLTPKAMVRALERIWESLEPGGFLFIGLPDIGQRKDLLETFQKLKESGETLFPGASTLLLPENPTEEEAAHLNYHDRDTITDLLAAFGFDIQEAKPRIEIDRQKAFDRYQQTGCFLLKDMRNLQTFHLLSVVATKGKKPTNNQALKDKYKEEVGREMLKANGFVSIDEGKSGEK